MVGLLISLLITGVVSSILIIAILKFKPLLQNAKMIKFYNLLPAIWWNSTLRFGCVVFVFNFLLFGTALLLFIGTMILAQQFNFPLPFIVIALAPVVLSVMGWVTLGRLYEGENKWASGLIGSCFYWMIGLLAVIRLSTLKPQFEGDDTFMAAIGVFMLLIVAVVAAVTCVLSIAATRRI